MTNIIIMDNRPYIRYRVKELIEKGEIVIHEVTNSTQLFNKISELNNDVALLIMEINLKDEDGVEVIKKLRNKKINVPFMVLTSVNTREAFIKYIKAGAVDYFLKPFNGSDFAKRVIKHAINGQSLNTEDVKEVKIQTDHENSFSSYMENAINNALQNNKSISFIMFIVFKSESDLTISLNSNHEAFTDYAFSKIKALTKEVDRFERYGSNAYIGIYPSLSENEIFQLNDKITSKFKELKKTDTTITNYYFDSVCATIPEDGKTYEEVVEKLTGRLNNKILMLQKKRSSS